MTAVVSVLALTIVMAGGTWFFGWWAIVVLGLGWGAVRRSPRRPGLVAAWGAGFGWGGLLFWMSRQGPLGEVAALVGGITGLPASGVIAMTILFAAVVAGTGATVSSAVVDKFFPQKPSPAEHDA